MCLQTGFQIEFAIIIFRDNAANMEVPNNIDMLHIICNLPCV